MNNSYWIWYPGDFEHYHAMKQNFSRVERGCPWPAFWKSEGFRNRVAFRREYALKEETRFTVFGVTGSQGYVQVGESKYPFGAEIVCSPGPVRISVHIGCIGCVPSVFVQGDIIRSDDGWLADDYDADPVPAAHSRYFTDPDRDPAEWAYTEKVYEPVSAEQVCGGMLYGFETELTAALELSPLREGLPIPVVYLGESRAEALDTENCYYHCSPDPADGRCPRQALRFAFLPDCAPGDYAIRAMHQYIDIPVRAEFQSDDEELNRIFAVAAHTFMLCSGAFFLDGIKRDKWIWGGDAYQSLFVNHYLTADREIEKRTLIALRGNDPVTTHVNTILDYSLLWLLSVDSYYESYGDRAFVDFLWPKMESLMELCMGQREEHGFIVGRKRDWVYIDWAEFDRDGPLCAEQMLLCEAYRVMAKFAPVEKCGLYEAERAALLEQLECCFWDAEKQAYIDSFTSGRRHVTRHASIFAILFDIADEERKKTLARSVLFNDAVPAITTPYFRFYELEVLCRLGFLEEVLREIKRYWGGMLKLGAVTFWEEYDPDKPLEEQYEMYGDPFGKSLCHAWAAGPIYLLARYFVGLKPCSPGGTEYTVSPRTEFFRTLQCRFPMGEKQLRIHLEHGILNVTEEQAAE
ncbi:MAG: alpha-L-rhamnosidase [Oscillospiraceae bacterium]|nr:alpha-L-rhamnosidase [Oscillospiraceae bacterium]